MVFLRSVRSSACYKTSSNRARAVFQLSTQLVQPQGHHQIEQWFLSPTYSNFRCSRVSEASLQGVLPPSAGFSSFRTDVPGEATLRTLFHLARRIASFPETRSTSPSNTDSEIPNNWPPSCGFLSFTFFPDGDSLFFLCGLRLSFHCCRY